MTATHDVTNQSPPFEDVNLFSSDAVLRDAVRREHADDGLEAFGAIAGSKASFTAGRLANENPPRLKTHDRQGRRIDVVEFHPAYHALMQASAAERLHFGAWMESSGASNAAPHANASRAARFYMAAQMEAGHCCPITMTNAAVPTLALQPELAATWLPRIKVADYDERFLPSDKKRAVTFGMGMTEKQGGTDVRANTTRAVPAGPGGPGREYILTGHKWFMSGPMSDAFLVLAQAPGGLSCFLLPRFLPDGTVNKLALQRLKDKLGNRSNASSEVELDGAHAWLIGEEGRGVAAIIEMVTYTRLDCAVASAGLMRLALAHAMQHAAHRSVFGRLLIDQPLMRAVLADLALDVEAAVALSFRLARAFDDAATDESAAAWRRVMTPVTKYWICKIAPNFAYEAMECLGGNGYVEELPLARIYREVPVNAIWEGSGNVMALDLLRVLQKDRRSVATVMETLAKLCASNEALRGLHASVGAALQSAPDERYGRRIVEGLAILAASCILQRSGPVEVSDAFIATRLQGPLRQTYGVPVDPTCESVLLARAAPQ